MKALFTATAVACAIATTASAAPSATPYVLSAAHEDFLMQLDDVAGVPGQIGTAARAAADLMRRHNETEEAVILPFLEVAETAVSGTITGEPVRGMTRLRAELPQIMDGQEEVVMALVELSPRRKSRIGLTYRASRSGSSGTKPEMPKYSIRQPFSSVPASRRARTKRVRPTVTVGPRTPFGGDRIT